MYVPCRLKQASAGVYLLLYMEKAVAVRASLSECVVVSDIGHARLSVGAKPGRVQGVKPPAGIFGRRGCGMFPVCILLFAQ